ncbi:MAG: hypothetical protein DRI90_01310 [Deltaproteobacteria bacterium]|nr:MAG: hypothetical protein DRI90_01310 [Deltaproteobacteria bacterium]
MAQAPTSLWLVPRAIRGDTARMGSARLRLAFGATSVATLLVMVPACDEDLAAPGPVADAGVDATPDGEPDAGPQPGPCPAGQLELDDGACQPAGIPPEACGDGFVPTDDGACDPVLPDENCSLGTMAIPGETECRPVAPCGTGTWGDIPIEPTTQHVDGAYGGSNSNGSATDPWTTIQEAVDAADPGAIVAVAAGSYVEDLWILAKPVRLWGKCPAEAEVVGSDSVLPAIYIYEASGAEVRDLAATGAGMGIFISDSQDVRIDRVWIHDAPAGGLGLLDVGEGCSVRLSRSLIEWVGDDGAHLTWVAELTVQDSVVRDTQPDSSQHWGRGLTAMSDLAAPQRSQLWVRRSLIERNHQDGIRSFGANVTVQDTVIRDTLPAASGQGEGSGILMGPAVDDDGLSSLTLLRSVIAGNHSCGVCTTNANGTVEATVVRGTKARASDEQGGFGLGLISDRPSESTRPQVTVTSSVIEQSHSAGLAVAGLDVIVAALIVRDTEAEVAGGHLGRGVAAELNAITGEPATLEIYGSVIERSHEAGLALIGSTAVIDGTVVRDTQPQPANDLFGRGVVVQLAAETLARSDATIVHSLIEGNHEAGLYVGGSDAWVQDSVIFDSKPHHAQRRDSLWRTLHADRSQRQPLRL